MFLNSNGTEDDVNEELKGFLRLMNGEEPADEFCREVQDQLLPLSEAAKRLRMTEDEFRALL